MKRYKVYFNGHNGSDLVCVEFDRKIGWVNIGQNELFQSLVKTGYFDAGDAVGRHDVSHYVRVDGDVAIIKRKPYEICWC